MEERMNAPDKCPKCRSKKQPCLSALVIQFECGSMVDAGERTWHEETHQCVLRQRDQLSARVRELEDVLETAWSLITNVSEGDWQKQSPDWQQAVVKWRDTQFHPVWSVVAARREAQAKVTKS